MSLLRRASSLCGRVLLAVVACAVLYACDRAPTPATKPAPAVTQQESFGSGAAESVLSLELDRAEYTVADRIHLTLELRTSPDAKVAWPDLNAEIKDLRVVSTGRSTLWESGGHRRVHTLFATLEAPTQGQRLIPALAFAVTEPSGRSHSTRSQPVPTTALGLVPATEDLTAPLGTPKSPAIPDREPEPDALARLLMPVGGSVAGVVIIAVLAGVALRRGRLRRSDPVRMLRDAAGRGDVNSVAIALRRVLSRYIPEAHAATEIELVRTLNGTPTTTTSTPSILPPDTLLIADLLQRLELARFASEEVRRTETARVCELALALSSNLSAADSRSIGASA